MSFQKSTSLFETTIEDGVFYRKKFIGRETTVNIEYNKYIWGRVGYLGVPKQEVLVRLYQLLYTETTYRSGKPIVIV